MQTKGDTLQYEMTVDADITNWKIRAELIDKSGSSVKLATTNSGGSDDQIEKTAVAVGESTFLMKFPSGQTDDFSDECTLEVEIDTGSTVGGEAEIYTIFSRSINLKTQKIDWTDPTA